MAVSNSPVYEGDVIFLYCTEAHGYVYSDPPSSSLSRVTVFTSDLFAPRKDPAFPNVRFAAFQILPSNAKPISDTMAMLKVQDAYSRILVYGRKIKLLHLASKKLLSFGSLKHKGSSHSSMACLAESKKKEEYDCLLRVLPSQTGIRKLMGEDVLFGDSVRLECGTHSGYCLLCRENVKPSRFEMKKATTHSVFTMSMHIRGREKIHRGGVRGGAVVLISNLKKEVYLSSQASIASDILEDKEEEEVSDDICTTEEESDVGLQQQLNPVLRDLLVTDLCTHSSKEVTARKQINLHSSRRVNLCGDVFWQLEYFSNPLSGDWVQFGSKVRIKHVPSQRYLAVVYKNDIPEVLTLKKQCSSLLTSPEVAFSLVQTEKKEGTLTKTSYVEIQHTYGEHVRSLVINTCQSFLRKKPITESSDDIDVEVEQYDQVYGLSLIDQRGSQFNKDLLLFKIEEVQTNFVQDFYYVLGVTKVLVEYVQKCDTGMSSDFIEVPEYTRKAAKVLGNWMKQDQLSQVQAEMLRVTKAVDVMMKLILCRKNDWTKRHRKFLGIMCTILEHFVTVGGKRCCFYLARKEYIDLLLQNVGYGIKAEKVLSALARDEINISELIVNHLIEAEIMHRLQEKDVPTIDLLSALCFSGGRPVRRLQAMILQTIIKEKASLFSTKLDEEAQVVKISKPDKLAGTTLNTLDHEVQNIIAAQIKLFSRICKGVNKDFIHKVVEEHKLVTLKEAFLCIKDTNLDPFLQSAYLDFIVSTLVDVNVGAAGTSLDKMWYTFDWEYLKFNPEDAVADPFANIQDETSYEMMQDLQATIGKCTEETSGTKEMRIETLNAMEPLVAYGFYWNADNMKSTIEMLVALIRGSHSEETQTNEKNRSSYKLKTKALDILYLFFLRVSYLALQKLVYDYGFLKEKATDCDNYTRPSDVLESLMTCESSVSTQLTNEVRLRLRYYLKEKDYELFENLKHTSNDLIQSLINLIQFDDDRLRFSSCRLLFAIFHVEKTLLSQAEKSYIYTEDLYPIQDLMMNLAVFNDPDPEKQVDGNPEKLIWQMLQGHAESGVYKVKAIAMLKNLADLLIMDRKDFIPNHVNQNLAYSTGLVSRLLEYVHYYCKERKGNHTDLVTKACLVLQRSARRNAKVQAKLFEGYTDLLGAHNAPNAVAELITEIFTDNAELCSKVSVSELSLIFYIASTGKNQEELFTALQAITKTCKSGFILMPKFQDILAKLFLESVHSTFNFLLAMDDGKHTYLDILKDKSPDNPKLVKILNVCDLLCICSDGAKKFPEDVCQAIFRLDELIEVLKDNSIPLERRKPFASLLTQVYLISDRESLKAVSWLEESNNFWIHTKFAAQLMILISDPDKHDIQHCFSTERPKFKTLLYYLAHHHLSIQTWRRLSNGISAKVSCSSHEEDPLLSSVLLYIMEGFLPMITAFCDQLSEKHKADITSKQARKMHERMSVLTEVGEGIVRVVQNQMLKNILFDSKYHVRVMNQCLEKLMVHIPNLEWSLCNKTLQAELGRLERSPSLYSALNDGFTKAVELNKSFMQFVEKYRQAYIGKTNKRDPLGIGENLVPCDPSFMKLISCFHPNGKCTTDQRVKQLKPLLVLLDELYQQLQQPLSHQKRSDLDSILLTTLQLLSAITPTPRSTITQSEDDEEVKRLQEALIAKPCGAHKYVIAHLAHPQNQIAVQAMAFLAALVYRSTEKTQWVIGQYLKIKDTELFVRMVAILELASVSIKDSPRDAGWSTVGTETGSKPEDAPVASSKSKVAIEMTSYQQIVGADLDTGDQAKTKAKWKQTSVMEESDLDESPMAFHQEKTVEEATQQVMVVLDLVVWMCHGQRTENQDLFREQENQFNSVNIVSQVAFFLQVLVEPLRKDSIHIVLKATQALIELCTGNFANQQAVYKAQIVETISNVLVKQSTELREEDEKKLLELKSYALELLNVLLQETSNDCFELLQKISRDISTVTILKAMLTLKEIDQKENNQKKIDQMKPATQKGMFNAFHAWKRIGDNLNQPEFDIEEEVRKLRKETNDSLEGLSEEEVTSRKEKADKIKADKIKAISKWSRSIEVIYRSKTQEPVLTRVYFPFNPEEEEEVVEKSEFITWNIDRASQEKKLKDFTKWMKEIYLRLQHKENMQRSKVWKWSYFHPKTRYWILIFLTLLLNLLTIIFFKAPTNGGSGSGDNHNSSVTFIRSSDLHLPFGYFPVLYVLGFLHLIFSVWMFIEYIVKNWKNFSLQKMTKFKKFIKQFCKRSIPTEEPEDRKYFKIDLIGFQLMYRLMFVFFSILSLVFYGYWYCGCLLYIFLELEVLDQVWTSLCKTAKQLLHVFLFGLCIIFIYAVVSFAFFHAYFNASNDLYCETLAQCFATVTREGLLGSLTDAIQLPSSDQDPTFWLLYSWKVFFDLSFFIIIIIIGFNVVVAIMVNSFSQLREDRDTIAKEDSQTTCFICGVNNLEFEKSTSFKDHVKKDHNMLNYIYFYLHLQSIRPSDRNAMEKYVFRQIEKNNIDFFPLRTAKVLEKQKQGQEKARTKNGNASNPGGGGNGPN